MHYFLLVYDYIVASACVNIELFASVPPSACAKVSLSAPELPVYTSLSTADDKVTIPEEVPALIVVATATSSTVNLYEESLTVAAFAPELITLQSSAVEPLS